MSSQDRYPDCQSCAFRDDGAICDFCEDADQWEWGEPDDEGFDGSYKAKEVIRRAKRVIKIKEVA